MLRDKLSGQSKGKKIEEFGPVFQLNVLRDKLSGQSKGKKIEEFGPVFQLNAIGSCNSVSQLNGAS